MRDQWGEVTLEKGHWFDSDLCILEPVNSMQMIVFEQLKMAGLLCSRYEVSSKTNATPSISQSRDVWRINLIKYNTKIGQFPSTLFFIICF